VKGLSKERKKVDPAFMAKALKNKVIKNKTAVKKAKEAAELEEAKARVSATT